MVPSRKKARICLDISSDINNTTPKKLDRKVRSTSSFCVGIADSTDDKIKLYIAESLRSTASFYEYDASLKTNDLLFPFVICGTFEYLIVFLILNHYLIPRVTNLIPLANHSLMMILKFLDHF